MATRSKLVRTDDGYLNSFLPPRSRNFAAQMSGGGGYLMSQPVLQLSYLHNGFSRLICDKPAEEMTRAGFEIEGLDDAVTESIKSRLEELEATKRFNEAIKWRNAFGGGLIVLGIDDGGNLESPLNEENVTAVEFMRVYDRFESHCDKRYDNPNDIKFGEVELWAVSPKTGGSTYKVHESRVLVFDGESVPNDVRVSNQGWGASVIQKCFVQLNRLDNSHKLSLLLLERMQQAIHGIPDLSGQVSTPEGEELVRKRISVVDAVRGALNTVVIDALETYELKSMSLSGVKDVLDKALNSLSAVSSVPTFLLGEHIGGLSNGDTNRDGWYSQIEAWQNDQYRKPLDRLISLLLLAESEGATDGGEYTIEFNPLSTPSDKDQAEIDYKKEQSRKVKMETLTGYQTAGIIEQDEVRDEIRDDYELVGDAPELPDEPLAPITLNPGQTLVDPVAGSKNPLPVGNK